MTTDKKHEEILDCPECNKPFQNPYVGATPIRCPVCVRKPQSRHMPVEHAGPMGWRPEMAYATYAIQDNKVAKALHAGFASEWAFCVHMAEQKAVFEGWPTLTGVIRLARAPEDTGIRLLLVYVPVQTSPYYDGEQ